MIKLLAPLAFSLIASFATAQTGAGDRYVGYYYPPVTSGETFERVVRSVPGVGRNVRVDFVNKLTAAQLATPESPRFVFFTKGEKADKLILVALDDEVFSTLFRARALMAQLTVSVRSGGFFRAQELQSVVTFYDMLQLLQFDTLVISDGEEWSHKIDFER